jgi:hypothetical protein
VSFRRGLLPQKRAQTTHRDKDEGVDEQDVVEVDANTPTINIKPAFIIPYVPIPVGFKGIGFSCVN